jgi:hypothetical protein
MNDDHDDNLNGARGVKKEIDRESGSGGTDGSSSSSSDGGKKTHGL